MFYVFAIALLARLTSADHFYIYASAPGAEIDKWLVDIGTIPRGEFTAEYYFLTSDTNLAKYGFNGGGIYGKWLFNPSNDPMGVQDLLLTDGSGMVAEWPNGIIETDYSFYACNSMDVRVPTDQWVIFGKGKEGHSSSDPPERSSTEIPSVSNGGPTDLPVSDPTNDVKTVEAPTGAGGPETPLTDVSKPVDTNTIHEPNTDVVNTDVNTDGANTDVVNTDGANTGVVDTSTETTAPVSPEMLFERESPPAFNIDFDKCIPIVLHTLANLTDLEPSCMETSCIPGNGKPKCLTSCLPCWDTAICTHVCSYVTICDGVITSPDTPTPSPDTPTPSPDTPVPNPNTPSPKSPTPNPNTPSPNSPTPNPNTPSPSIEIIKGCPTCFQTVIDYVFTCPSSTTITISTCPQVNVCSQTVLLLPPGTHSITGRAVVPVTSGSITVTRSASGSSATSSARSSSGSSRPLTGSLTTFNGAVKEGTLVGPLLGLLVYILVLV